MQENGKAKKIGIFELSQIIELLQAKFRQLCQKRMEEKILPNDDKCIIKSQPVRKSNKFITKKKR